MRVLNPSVRKTVYFSFFTMMTMLLVTRCAAGAESAAAISHPPNAESTSNNEQALITAEEQFSEIQQILTEMDMDQRQKGTSPLKASEGGLDSSMDSMSMGSDSQSGSMTSMTSMTGGMMMGEKMSGMSASKGMGGDSQSGSMTSMTGGMMMGDKMPGMSGANNMPRMSMMGQSPVSEGNGELPGYSEIPHLYHLGESGFYLDYSQQLSFSERQIESLMLIQNEWITYQETQQAAISMEEKSLWQLTAQAQPNINDIKEKIGEIEALNRLLRLKFITLVGSAVEVLQEDQAAQLVSLGPMP